MLKLILNARLPAAAIFSRADSMMDIAELGVGVGSGTGDGDGVGSGMFDAATGPLTVTLVGVIGNVVGSSAVDTDVGTTVGVGSSPQADSSAATTRLRIPARATRSPVSSKPTRYPDSGHQPNRKPRMPRMTRCRIGNGPV